MDAVQLFDSWAGALSLRDYRRFVFPHSVRALAGLADTGLPRIHFRVGTGELLEAMAQADADVVGVDWRIPLDVAVQRVRAARTHGPIVLQGNLDPGRAAGGVACCREGGTPGDRGGVLGRRARAQPRPRRPPGNRPDVLTRVVELAHSL